MNVFSETLIEYLRSKLFGPKDFFERTKKRLVRRMIWPLFGILGFPPLVLGILSTTQYIEINYQGALIKFFGAASNDSTILAVTIVITFLFTLGCNLFYAMNLRKSEVELKQLESTLKREDAFDELMSEFNALLTDGKNQEALYLGSYIVSRYPDIVDNDPKIIKEMIKLGAAHQISFSNKNQLALPPKEGPDE